MEAIPFKVIFVPFKGSPGDRENRGRVECTLHAENKWHARNLAATLLDIDKKNYSCSTTDLNLEKETE